MYMHVFTSLHISDHRHVLYMNPCCANSHMCALASAQTKILWPGHARTMGCDKSLPSNNLRVFFLHMYKHILFFCVYVCLRVLNLRWDILVLVDFFQNVQSHTEHFVLSQWRLELASIAETERLNWNDNRLCWLKKMVSAYLTVGWRGSHSKNLVHRNGLTVRTLEAKRFLVWRFFEGSKCAEWKFWKKKVLSDCPSVQCSCSHIVGCNGSSVM